MEQVTTQFERNLSFNFLTRWLHSYRFGTVRQVVAAMHAELGRPVRIIDIGCNDGTLFDRLREVAEVDYTGIELREEFATLAARRHAGIPSFRVLNEGAQTALEKCGPCDLITAIDTMEHIPEHDVVRIVEQVAALKVPLFVVVPVEIGPAIWMKNVGSALCGYIRHKEYTWAQTFWSGLYQLDRVPPHGVRHMGFDWRWLAQTIRHNMHIDTFKRFPLNFLPVAFASSVCMIAKPR